MPSGAPAGELVVQHARSQSADLDRVRSRVADLQGNRRGHVEVACNQAFVQHDLPDEIEGYHRRHPQVSFDVRVRHHAHAVAALLNRDVHLASVLQPPPTAELQPLPNYDVPLCAMMGRDHPLAGKGPVRLRDCLRHTISLPDRSLAIRHILDAALVRVRRLWTSRR